MLTAKTSSRLLRGIIPAFILPQKGATRTMTSNETSNGSIPPLAHNFPSSTASPSAIFHFPGVTHESTELTRRVLEENDRTHDVFMKLRFAHNHFPHSVLTRYALGAPPKLLDDTWKHEDPELANLDPRSGDRKTGDLSKLPKKMDRSNWDDPKTLGFKDAYSSYLVFFHEEIERLGPLQALEEYVFSPQANGTSSNGHPPPRMLAHLVAGAAHPFIHAGFGVEFKDRVVLAEGLAQAAVHEWEGYHDVFPADWPAAILPDPAGGKASPPSHSTSESGRWDVVQNGHSTITAGSGKSLLEVYVNLCEDDDFKPGKYDPNALIQDRISRATEGPMADKLRKLVGEWDLSDAAMADGNWEAKSDEMGLFATLLACATSRKGYDRRVDFFLMHALTSSIFLPAFLPHLSPPNRRVLLTTYGLAMFVISLSRGRPRLYVEYLMEADLYPSPPTSNAKKGGETPSDPMDRTTANAWTDIIQSCLYAPECHLTKSIRPLVYHSQRQGATPPGGFVGTTSSSGKETLPGMSKLDGTVFVRSAGVIMEVMGWHREGQKGGNWDRSALGYDEAWK